MNSTTAANLTQCNPEDLLAQSPVDPPTHATLIAWLFLNISASQVLLPILVIGLFCSKPRAESTLINIVFGWIIYGIVSSILLYSHNQVGCEPPPILCLAQASLYISIPPLICTLLLNAVLQILLNLRERIVRSAEAKYHLVRKICLLLIPYIVYAFFATTIAAAGASSPVTTLSRTRRFFYCSIRSSFLVDSVMGFCMTILTITLIILVWIGYLLHKNWASLRQPGNDKFDFGYLYRMGVFYVYTVIILSLAFLPKNQLVAADVGMSTMGYATLVIFGSRMDPWRVYLRVLPQRAETRFFRRRSIASDKVKMLSSV